MGNPFLDSSATLFDVIFDCTPSTWPCGKGKSFMVILGVLNIDLAQCKRIAPIENSRST